VGRQTTLAEQRLDLLEKLTLQAEEQWRRHRYLEQNRSLSKADLAFTNASQIQARQVQLDQQINIDALKYESQRLTFGLESIATETQMQVRSLRSELRRLKEQRVAIQAATLEVIVAPHRGIVVDVALHPGVSLVVGSHLLTLNRTQLSNYAEVWLSSLAAGRVHAGQVVHLRLSGFPEQEFGLVVGRVIQVATASKVVQGKVSFRALVQFVDLPEGVSSIPAGMTVSDEVKIETQTIWRWLLRPLQRFEAQL
jgi:hypothetical protein